MGRTRLYSERRTALVTKESQASVWEIPEKKAGGAMGGASSDLLCASASYNPLGSESNDNTNDLRFISLCSPDCWSPHLEWRLIILTTALAGGWGTTGTLPFPTYPAPIVDTKASRETRAPLGDLVEDSWTSTGTSVPWGCPTPEHNDPGRTQLWKAQGHGTSPVS